MKFEKVNYTEWWDGSKNTYYQHGYHDAHIRKPERATPDSMGYDFYSTFTFSLEVGRTLKLPLGIKFNPKTEKRVGVLMLPRSGLGSKGLNLTNQIGAIDPDYYNNPDTGGMILADLVNNGRSTLHIIKGQAILQGILTPFHVTEDDKPRTAKRLGGFGSTDA